MDVLLASTRLAQFASLSERFRADGEEKAADACAGAFRIAEAVRAGGGRALLAGGFVRDVLLGRVPVDIDIEVYGLSFEQLHSLLASVGTVKETGKVFAVLQVVASPGVSIDVALPRRETKSGMGHTGFAVQADPLLSFAEACRRRDFTVNAILADPLTGEMIDPLHGVRDLQRCLLRVADTQHFGEDPLRVFRGMQLAARLDLRPTWRTVRLMRSMCSSLSELPVERISLEWRKLLLFAEKPSLGLVVARQCGVTAALYPELEMMVRTRQERAWHPEGTVWTHTLMVVDEMAQMIRRDAVSDTEAFPLMLAALLHDIGKPKTTRKEQGRLRSHGHAAAGEPLAKEIMSRMGISTDISERVIRLVRCHLDPAVLYVAEHVRKTPVTDGAIRRLARRLAPATIRELLWLAEADHRGRGPFTERQRRAHLFEPDGFLPGPWLLERAERVEALAGKPPDVVRGQDLLTLGYQPGKAFGAMMRLANLLRDEQELTRETLLAALKEAAPDAEKAQATLSALLVKSSVVTPRRS